MQFESIVEQYRDQLRDALFQSFGLRPDRADPILSDFVSWLDQSDPTRLPPITNLEQLITAVTEHASRLLGQSNTGSNSVGQFPIVPPVTSTPRFSATKSMDAEVTWALQILAPAVSLTSHTADPYSHWQLFERSRLRPMLTGQPRPPIETLTAEFGFDSQSNTESAIEAECVRWQSYVAQRLQEAIPRDIPSRHISDWYIERHELVREVLQLMMNANHSDTIEQLRVVQRLLAQEEANAAPNQPSHVLAGLRHWQTYIQERVDNWKDPMFVYDVNALLSAINPETVKPISPARSSAQQPVTDTVEPLGDSIDEILDQLSAVLMSPLPSDNDLFLAHQLNRPGNIKSHSTIGELLFSTNPSEYELRLLKDISKQQGPDASRPWHVAVSKLLYFATIAAFVLRIHPVSTKITSLSMDELSNAFQWAQSLPRVSPQLRQLFRDASSRIQ